jgi:folate-binding protein YgfZ
MTPTPETPILAVPAADSAPSTDAPRLQLVALLRGSAFAPIADLGWIRVTGDDRVRWLNGMVTNSIQELAPGRGNYNFLLSAQGRIQGDGFIFAEPTDSGDSESILLETALTRIPTLTALLDRFIIMDDVELTDISSSRSGMLLAGPQALGIVQGLFPSGSKMAELTLQTVSWREGEVTLIHAHSPLVPRYELWSDPATIAALTDAFQQAGALHVSDVAVEQLRLLEGTPRYGTDIRDRELPQETAANGAQSRALHFAKGCYLGQEIVERIRSRGNVHRTFTAFRLEGTLPDAGTLLQADSKQVGEITSVAAIPLPTGTVQLALGYIRREALDRRLSVTYPGGTAAPIPTPFEGTKTGAADL